MNTALYTAAMLMIGTGALLTGLGFFFWGVRHLFFARRELEAERSGTVPARRPLATQ